MDPVPRHGITRRSALALGAAGFATLTRGVPGAAAAVPLRGLTVAPSAFATDGVSAVLRAPARFGLLGVLDARRAPRLEVRTRVSGGAWSPWLRVHAGHAPDDAGAQRASDPVFTGQADELQLRVPTAPRGALRLRLVPVGGAHVAARRVQAVAPVPGAPPIVARAAWGGDAIVPRATPDFGRVDVAIVHHTEGGNAYTAEQAPGIVLAIARYHRDIKGWNDVGYNFLVDRYGTIYEGRAGGVELAVVGAHAQGFNRLSTGISILGSFTDVLPPEAALEAVAGLIGWKLPYHGSPVTGTITVISGGGALTNHPYGSKVPLQRISGHRDADSTACPGNALYAQLPALRSRAAALAQPIQGRAVVTLAGPAAAPAFGAPAQITGTVSNPDGSAAVAAPVSIQKLGRSGAWSTVARAQAGADGAFAAAVLWRRGGTVRARALKQVSQAVDIALTPLLTARVNRPVVTAGRSIHVRGTLGPAGPLAVLVEVQGAGGVWRTARTVPAVARRGGSFVVPVRFPKPGSYRVSVRTASAGPIATAGPFPVRVSPQRRLGGVSAPR